MKIQLRGEKSFSVIPFVEITNENLMKLMDSCYLFTVDKYLKSWNIRKREVGLILNIISMDKDNDICYCDVIVRIRLIDD